MKKLIIVLNCLNSKPAFFKPIYSYRKLPGENCVFPQCRVARHHVCVGIFKLPTRKADVTWKKELIQMIEKYCLVDKNLRERLELANANTCELHYKKDDIKFTSKLQNKFSYFRRAYCFF